MNNNYRLTTKDMGNLVGLSLEEGFPYRLNDESAALYCDGTDISSPGVQTYGMYEGDELVSVMTATFAYVFPHGDSPSGKMCHISGAFTRSTYRNRGYAATLLRAIERDAISWGADYLCCDSSADGLYIAAGFKSAPENESRLWKPLEQNA